jgi:hypothetical protein
VFAQIASGFGLMVEVDWSTLFKSFYETVRVKIACKNYQKIPHDRLYEMNQKIHLISFTVEVDHGRNNTKPAEVGDDGGDDGHKDDDEEADDLYDTDKEDHIMKNPSASKSSKEKTPTSKSAGTAGGKTVSMSNGVEDPFNQKIQLKKCMEGLQENTLVSINSEVKIQSGIDTSLITRDSSPKGRDIIQELELSLQTDVERSPWLLIAMWRVQ